MQRNVRHAAIMAAALWAGTALAETEWREYPPHESPETSNLSDALASGDNILGVRILSGSVQFEGANTYTGGTEIKANATFYAHPSSVDALGSGAVHVEDGGTLRFRDVSIANDVYLDDGGILRVHASAGNVATNAGVLTLPAEGVGIVRGEGTAGTRHLAGTITGAGDIDFRVEDWNHTVDIHIWGDNDYTGETTIQRTGTSDGHMNVWVRHPNALGTTTGAIHVLCDGVLTIRHQDGLHTNKTVNVKANTGWGSGPAAIRQHADTTLGNAIVMSGGTANNPSVFFMAVQGNLAQNNTYSGTMTLQDGTTDIRGRYLTHVAHWFQTGRITGAGALRIGVHNDQAQLYLRGDNDYSGGTTVGAHLSRPDFRLTLFGC